MPSDTTKTLLARIKFDENDWNKQVESVRARLKDVQEQLKAGAQELKDKTRQQADAEKQLYAVQREAARTSQLESQELFARKKAQYDQEYTKIKELYAKKQISEKEFAAQALILNTKLTESETAMIKRRYDVELEMLTLVKDTAIKDEKEKQIAMQRSMALLRAESASARRGTAMAMPPIAPGEGGGPGFFGRIAGGYMRGGIAGLSTVIAGGVFKGELALQTLETVIRKFESLTEAIKEAGKEAGIEAQQEQTLRAIAGSRVHDMEAFILQMRDATRHLVDDSGIFRAATQAFRSSSQITSQQIIQLTNDSVKLGIAANGPEGASRAMQAVTTYLTSGRSYALAYALALSSTDRQLLMTGTRATTLAQRLQQMNLVLSTVHNAAAKIPEPLMTVSMAQEQYRVTLGHLQHEMAGVLQTSPGLVAIWRTLAEVMEEKLKQFDENKKKFTEVIDGMTQALAAFVSALATLASYIIPLVAEFISWIPRIQQAYYALKGGMTREGAGPLREQLAFVRGAPAAGGTEQGNRLRDMLQSAGLIKSFRASDTEVEAGRQKLIKTLEEQIGQTEKTANAEKELEENARKAADALEQSGARVGGVLQDVQRMLQKYAAQPRTGELPGGPPAPEGTPPLTFQQQASIREAEARNRAERRETAILELKEDAQQRLQIQQDLLRKGEISEQDYATAVSAIQKQMYVYELSLIEAKRRGQVEALKASEQDARVLAPKIAKANLDALKAQEQAWAKYQLTVQKTGEELTANWIAQVNERADAEKEARITVAKEDAAQNEATYKEGGKSYQDYYAGKRKSIQDELVAIIDAEQKKLSVIDGSSKEARKIEEAYYKEVDRLEKEWTQTYLSEAEKRKAIAEREMQLRVREAEAAVGEARRPSLRPVRAGGIQFGVSEPGAAEQLTQLKQQIQKEIAVLREAIAAKQAEIAGMKGESDARGKAQGELDGLNKKLEDAQGQFDTTSPQTPLGALINAFQELGDKSVSLKDRFMDFEAATMNVVQTVAGIVGGIESVRNAPTMMAGMQSGAQTGQSIGTLVGGPIGGAVGQFVGAVVGAIQGAFNRGQIKIQQTIQENVNNITKWYSQGAITLTQAISDVEKEYETNLQRLSGDKYRTEKIALDNELAQLREQQRQILDAFETNLDVLNVGPALQDTATQIEGIIQQWKDYVAAGGDVTKANQFLTESFQNLNQTSIQQLDQSYQDAIQNAINYNQLLYDRAALLDQTAQQERDILNQGVLVRQTTVAQSKAYQLQRLEQQTQQQLQTMDEEITVAKYKMDAESKIFNLAQTRAGLEQQLAQVQMSVIDYDMIRIAALSQLVNEMKGGGIPMTNFIAALLATMAQNVPGGPQLNTDALQQLAAVLGVALTPGGATTTTSGPAYPGSAYGATTPAAAQPFTGAGGGLQQLFNKYYNLNGRYGSYGGSTTNSH